MVALADAAIDFVVIGGVAAQVHGSSRLTFDLDVAYAHLDSNLTKLAEALRSMNALLRGASSDLPVQLDARTLRAGANFTFATDYGAVDIFSDPAGAPPYDRLLADSVAQVIEGRTIRFASIDHLIAMREATGRPKDNNAAAELRTLADEIRRRAAEA